MSALLGQKKAQTGQNRTRLARLAAGGANEAAEDEGWADTPREGRVHVRGGLCRRPRVTQSCS